MTERRKKNNDDDDDDEYVAKALSKCGYPPWTIDMVKQDIVEKSLKDEAMKAKKHKSQSQRYGCRAICERTERGICKNSEISRYRQS